MVAPGTLWTSRPILKSSQCDRFTHLEKSAKEESFEQKLPTRLDIKGKGKSVSMVVWLLYERGNHAIARIVARGHRYPKGRTSGSTGPRQAAVRRLFAGLLGTANKGGIGAHVSENGGSSFGNIYARQGTGIRADEQ